MRKGKSTNWSESGITPGRNGALRKTSRPTGENSTTGRCSSGDQAGQDLARMTLDKGTWKAWARIQGRSAGHFQERAEFFEANATELNRSRRGWKWLYEAKCGDWAEALKENLQWQSVIGMIEDGYNHMKAEAQLVITQERALRDGWEQTAGELRAQVRQGDDNLQRVEAERDEAIQAVDHLREGRDRLQRRVDLQHATIERLEAAIKEAQRIYRAGHQRDRS